MLALIKKDKAESELRDSMEQQMEVFLQDNTGTFIDSLFTTLSSKDYLNGPPPKVAKKGSDDEEEVKNEEEKPDSTTSTPRDLGELSSELKEADNKSRRISEVRKIFTFCSQYFGVRNFDFTLYMFSRKTDLVEEVRAIENPLGPLDADRQVTEEGTDRDPGLLMIDVDHLIGDLDVEEDRPMAVDQDRVLDLTRGLLTDATVLLPEMKNLTIPLQS